MKHQTRIRIAEKPPSGIRARTMRRSSKPKLRARNFRVYSRSATAITHNDISIASCTMIPVPPREGGFV